MIIAISKTSGKKIIALMLQESIWWSTKSFTSPSPGSIVSNPWMPDSDHHRWEKLSGLQHLKCLLVASGKLWHLRKLLFFCIYKPQHHSDKPLQNCKHAAEIVQFFCGWLGRSFPPGSSLYQVTVNQYLMWILDLGQKNSMHAACLWNAARI